MFNKIEVETAAWWVVLFCQQREGGGSWQPISVPKLEEFYKDSEYDPPNIGILIERGLIVLQPDGLLHLTHELISTYFLAAPAAHQVTMVQV